MEGRVEGRVGWREVGWKGGRVEGRVGWRELGWKGGWVGEKGNRK